MLSTRKNIQTKIFAGFEYLIAIVLILDGRTMWTSLTTTVSWFSGFIIMLLTVAVLGCIIAKRTIDRKLGLRSLLFVGITLLYSTILMLLQAYRYNDTLRYMVALSLLILYYFLCAYDDKGIALLYKYSNIIIVIASAGLIIWLLGPVMGILHTTKTVYTTWTGSGTPMAIESYYGVFFNRQTLASLLGVNYRNSVIFTEAPMASFHFSVAMLVELFAKEKANRFKVLILILSILSTFAMSGYIFIICILFAKLIISRPKQKAIRYVKWFSLPLLLLIVSMISLDIAVQKLGTDSGSVRLDDFVVGFNAWKDNPLFGAGIGNDKYIQSYMNSRRTFNTGFSNSIFQILAHGGLYLGLLYLFPIVCGMKRSIKSKSISMMVFIMAVIYLVTFTVFSYQYLLFYLLIFIWKSNGITRKSNNFMRRLNT